MSIITIFWLVKLKGKLDILHLQIQNDIPCLWIKVNQEEKETEYHQFAFVATGQKEKEENLQNYLGTIMFSNLVYHLFEMKKSNKKC
jgi:hypothetical protein